MIITCQQFTVVIKHCSLPGLPVQPGPILWPPVAVGWRTSEVGNPEEARAGKKPKFLKLVNKRFLRTELENHEPGQGRDKKILGRQQLSRG